ncbi:MAG: hypothetical protein J6Z22_00200 [Lachnospiraceae bacterium]|nr:hypothetical protein [Lachnospiraceae bacterium]
MKNGIKKAILFVIFGAVLFLELFVLNRVLINKETSGVQSRFARFEKDSVHTVFIGNSHQYCSIDPDLLHEEYGIDTFMLATAGQTVPMSYYAALEAIEFQHPERIIFEVSYCANDFRTISPEMSHYFFDCMPACKARSLALKDLVGKDAINYLIPLSTYHGRWKELTEMDFSDQAVSERGGVHYEQKVWNDEIPLVDEWESTPMPEEMEKYMDLLVELCQENGVELILYAAPFNTLYTGDDHLVEDLLNRERIFNYVGEYALEKGIEYHNLFYELEWIGLAGDDWMDRQHLNYFGQQKFTRYMADMGYIR